MPLKAEQYVSQNRWNRFAPLQFNPQYPARIGLDACPRTHHANQPRRVERGLRVEAHCNPAPLPLDRRNPQPFTHGFEDGIVQKVFHGSWGCAKPVFQLRPNVLPLFLCGNSRNALVRPQAQVFAGDVVLRDADIQPQIERGAQVGCSFFAFEFGHGPLQHLAIHVKANGLDMPVLLAAKHVPRPAQL